MALIGIDVGTTSVRAIAFEPSGRRLAAAARPTPTRHLETGGEYDPDEIYAAVLAVLREIGAELAGRPVEGLAVSSFGESCVLIDAQGRSLAPCIVWHDRRTEPQARAVETAIGRDRVFELIGHSVEPIYTLAKLMWMRQHWPEAFDGAERVLMMADWIAFRLSGEAATDMSLASRTLYLDVRSRRWSDEMLALAGLNSDFPAPLRASGTALGNIRPEVLAATGLAGKPVVAVGGHDHILGALAAGLLRPGTVINSVGTAEALLLASERPLSDSELLRRGYAQGAIAADRDLSYLVGALLHSGGAFEWFRHVAGDPPQQQLMAEALTVPVGSGGVIFVPHLANGPPPQPDIHARGAFLGLTQTTTPAALYRATLEGVALQSRLMLDGMADLEGAEAPREIRLIGGTTRNPLFLAIKANVFARPVTVVEEPEATALGAALLGGVAGGVFPSFQEAWRGLERKEFVVEPDRDASERYDQLRTHVFAGVAGQLSRTNVAIAKFLQA